jgi:oligopeptide transport system permease protein
MSEPIKVTSINQNEALADEPTRVADVAAAPVPVRRAAATELERYAELLREAQSIHGVSLGRDAWRRLRRNWAAMAALMFLILLALLSILTPLLPLAPPRAVNLPRHFQAPQTVPLFVESWSLPADESAREQVLDQGFGELGFFSDWLLSLRVRWFGEWQLNSICGTDLLGRDLFSRLMWGSRVSLAVGLVATMVSLVIGVTWGAVAGYTGGRIDNAMMRFVDMLYSIPFIFVVIFLITILSEPTSIKPFLDQHGIDRIVIFFVVVGAIYWLTMSRVVRGQVISLKHNQFIEAARTIGASQPRIIFRHLVPNLLSIVIVYLTLTIPSVMLFEAFLSFLGLGVEAPDVSWGLLANEGVNVITPVRIYWWLVVFPSLALGLTLFSLNILGDGLRDALDPRLKNR